MRRLLVVMAHPDDESFGPAGTLALYAAEGVEIHLMCVTNGDASDAVLPGTQTLTQSERQQHLATIRQQELRRAAEVIGIAHIDFLNFPDGQLCNALYHAISEKIMNKMECFSPHVVIAPEPQGISGHLDHMAVSMITTYSFIKSQYGYKLYYVCLPKDVVSQVPHDNYFVYFPDGYEQSVITTRIDYRLFLDKKLAAMRQHLSQIDEANRLIKYVESFPKIDFFILHRSRNCHVTLPENHLFSGIPHEDDHCSNRIEQ